MDHKKPDFISVYAQLPDLSRNVINVLVVKYSGVNKYDSLRYFQNKIDAKKAQKEYQNVLNALIEKKLVIESSSGYDVPSGLKIELFPRLITEKRYKDMALAIQKEHNLYSYIPVTEYIRDFLVGYYVGENRISNDANVRLMSKAIEAAPFISEMLQYPEYDQTFLQSPFLLYNLLDAIQLLNVLNFQDYTSTQHFFERNPSFDGLYNQVLIQKAEMLFQLGKIDEADLLVKTLYNTDSLLLKFQIELFRGNFELSASYFEKAQVTDKDGTKISKMEFGLYYEFFYWLCFAFAPKILTLKKLDVAINKKIKSKYSEDHFLLPLLFFLKNDMAQAESKFNQINTMSCFTTTSFKSVYYLILAYVIKGGLNSSLYPLARNTGNKLNLTQRWLFLGELNFILEKSGFDADAFAIPAGLETNRRPSLMSRLSLPEKWEQLLDGLLTLTKGKGETQRKDLATARVCYLVNMDKGIIQPISQTINAKGVWSAGRNIALKRFKDQQVEGMTEQDRKVAASISHYTGYYNSTEYSMDFDKAIAELCGHPYLFLFSNPSVSVELVKAQPEIVTENGKFGIKLKTNIIDADQRSVLVKETQTRYKLISLSPQQQTIIRLINQGITIPVKGKAKLIETVSSLSGLMTVHSDFAEENAEVKSIEADTRIRVQIVPIGDGLKAQMFVKPLGTEPPYVKPGIGGKVVYGMVDGEKCQAVRNLKAENANAVKLVNGISAFIDTDLIEEAGLFSDPYDCLNLLEVLNENADIATVEWPEGEHFKMKKSASFANLSLRVKGKGQWFDLDGELNIDEDTVISLKELLRLNRKSKGRFLELKKDEFLALTEELKKHLDELESYSTIDKNGVSVNRFATHALEEITSRAASFKTDKSWKEFQKRIKANLTDDVQVPATLDAELRPYQEEGFRWMARLKTWDAGACLADDMGLGKTVQAIAMMLHLAENGPILVVCPASVVPNWGSELQKFAPTLNIVNLKQGNREDAFTALAAFDVLVITYGLLQTEEERISKIIWAMAVLDEAHAIKNTQTKSSKAAMNIQSGFKLALTGTPIQNHLGELWNLFNFCNPGLLGTLPQFTDRYVKTEIQAQKNHLKKLITPFILRRTKNKVLDELPPKTEITHSVTLSEKELAFYEALRREAINTIENNGGGNGQQHLQALAEITKLRLACCNTALVNKDIQLPSAKLEAFFEIVEELRANKHRALVFSQFVMHLAIVRKELDKQGISYQYLDGSTPIPDRQAAVKAFQAGKGELFLVSLKAGGLGLNLTAADYVLHLDPWWNPAIEDQASDRAHRIGQLRPVTIYRLVAKNTIEEKILRLHSTKRDLADSLLDGTDQSARLSTVDLLYLLKEV
ncbi:MAG: DEAD/DEAH box helicase [Prolixibacteraceae bacterium]|jgi:superfamily II DNA or RNA helicase